MWKEMYRKALKFLQRPVVVQHISGLMYHGLLIRVTKKGLYLWPFGHAVTVAGDGEPLAVETAEANAEHRPDPMPVYVGPLFFPFAVIASFAAGSLLGSAVSRPPYPYYQPYGPPYGGYPW